MLKKRKPVIKQKAKQTVLKKKKLRPLKAGKVGRDKGGKFLPGFTAGRPFTKGNSGNPNGRPKKKASITTQMATMLDFIPAILPNKEENKYKLTWAQIIAAQALIQAAKGGSDFMKEILNRVEGKVPETIRHGVEETDPDLVERIKKTFKW